MFYCLLWAGVPPVTLHEPQIPEEPGQKQALPLYRLAMADHNFQVKRLQRAHAHLLQLHPRFIAGTKSTINVRENPEVRHSVLGVLSLILQGLFSTNFFFYELFGHPQPCETHYLSFLPGLRWFEAQKRLRSVKTLSSTCGVGTIVADFARQFLLLTFRVPHPCEIHCLSLFPGM